MSEWKIYHNPKCSKSRQTLALLEAKGIQPEIINYLEVAPTASQLKAVISALGLPVANIVRVKEDVFKADKFDLNDEALVIKKLTLTPKLLERPIVIRGKRAIIGRPPENALTLFD